MSYNFTNSIDGKKGLFFTENCEMEWMLRHDSLKTNEPLKTKHGRARTLSFEVFIKAIFILFILLPAFTYAKNRPPKVNAGLDKVVVFPSSTTTTLSGSGSDAEGPVTFLWKQISGVSTAKIASPTAAITKVSNLIPGIYIFSLTVTDNSGVSRSDTVNVSVFQKLTWTIRGVIREALVHPPSGGTSTAAPVIFVFHGHGGTDSAFAAKGFELSWPQAIVVYPQGLRTKSILDTTNCKQSGWQSKVGEINCVSGVKDQDLLFFDTIYNALSKRYTVNTSQVFVHGWSEACDFVYSVLWAARRNKFRALGPAGGNLDTIKGKSPIPVIHVAGTQDIQWPFTEQKRDVDSIRKLDKCSSTGTVWATGANGLVATKYTSSINDNVVFVQYDGGHIYPSTIPALIVRFFKEVAGVATTKTTTAPLITEAPAPANKDLLVKRAP